MAFYPLTGRTHQLRVHAAHVRGLNAPIMGDALYGQKSDRLYLHAERLLLIEVENAYDGEIREKDGVFQSSKRKGNGVGIQSIQHIAEKSGGASTFTYQNGAFCAKVMLCG